MHRRAAVFNKLCVFYFFLIYHPVVPFQHFPSLPANAQNSLFATFGVDAHLVCHRSVTQVGKRFQRKIMHQPLTDVDQVADCLQEFLTRYNEQFNKSLPVVLYNQSLKHLVRIHRILTFRARYSRLYCTVYVNIYISFNLLTYLYINIYVCIH